MKEQCILISLKQEFALSIFSGNKKFEYRRTNFKNKNIKKAYVYVTKPTGKVVGEFVIENIIISSPKIIWKQTKNKSGISKKQFEEYFSNSKTACALEIGNVLFYKKYRNITEMFGIKHPPQSFIYVDNIT